MKAILTDLPQLFQAIFHDGLVDLAREVGFVKRFRDLNPVQFARLFCLCLSRPNHGPIPTRLPGCIELFLSAARQSTVSVTQRSGLPAADCFGPTSVSSMAKASPNSRNPGSLGGRDSHRQSTSDPAIAASPEAIDWSGANPSISGDFVNSTVSIRSRRQPLLSLIVGPTRSGSRCCRASKTSQRVGRRSGKSVS